MDIGVAMVGGVCQYFVNEITRMYGADFFAEWLSQPGTHICRAGKTDTAVVTLACSIAL
jgi:hypothetical protein